jgi:hypothetical protein
MTFDPHCFGALALEVSAEPADGRLCLARDQAEPLAAELAADLQRLLPGIERLDGVDGVFVGAHFDPAELLRPGWPVHTALAELAARVPGEPGGRVIAFGAEGGRMPTALLQPDPQFAGGLLRLLPFALLGPPGSVAAVGRMIEERLLDTGMAGAGLALHTQSRFGLQLEHARFLSLHDLCAMVSMQYRHAGLAELWRLIETALLAPAEDCWLRQPGAPLALLHGGQLRIADPDYAAWCERLAAPEQASEAGFAGMRRQIRQLIAVAGAHGIASERVPVAAGQDAEAALLPG